MSWKIAVAGGNLSFSAAHFITLDGAHEPLHGHNYGVSAELTGETLTGDSYLLDFGVLKDLLRSLIAQLNHRFLLPLRSPHLTIHHKRAEWEIVLPDGERFVLPQASVVALEIDNATAERLAEWFADRLCTELRAQGAHQVLTVTVGVSETEMQTAYHSRPFTIL